MIRQPLGRTVMAVALALAVLGATVVPPLLDATDAVHVAHVENGHDPATCAGLHDHTACIQLAKSFSQGSIGWATLRSPNLGQRGQGLSRAITLARRADSPAPSPRAPPIHLS